MFGRKAADEKKIPSPVKETKAFMLEKIPSSVCRVYKYCYIIKNHFSLHFWFSIDFDFSKWSSISKCSILMWQLKLENVNFLLAFFDVSINQWICSLCIVKSSLFDNNSLNSLFEALSSVPNICMSWQLCHRNEKF